MRPSFVLPAYAKINLALDVLHRRPDGYHEVETVMQNIALHDLVSFQVTAGKEIELYCRHPGVPAGADNIAYQAALLLQQRYKVQKGVRIEITKRIPVAGGLAGGSADAAATLKGLNRVWNLGLTNAELMAVSVELGADVPYCLTGGTCLARGIGEVLTPLTPVPSCWVVLAKPPGGLSTAEVYRRFKVNEVKQRPNIAALLHAIEKQSLAGVAAHVGNVLQEVSIKMMPQIATLQAEMLAWGAEASLMTGSGPTVFGLFYREKEAEATAEALKSHFPTSEIIVTHTMEPNFLDPH
ncbi:MAG: 4-(cytidine 5'-diphospho)-2-C-methyl-D-erythritol kinase [bacterium]|jgi:4-diphosphocytidyl-2-C-methyl-D-erythritol kinase